MVLYPLRSSNEGRKAGEFPVGQIHFDGQTVSIECPDRDLLARLRELFAQPRRVRAVRGDQEQVMAHTWITLEPGTEQHFSACVARLHHFGLVPG
ncbi:MAG: hypothetical protein AMXMBFR33_19380 [Candidatus Xenobia bacterium]|jgi:hypothetical protein